MDFVGSRYYRINAILLKWIGHWPHQPPKWQRLQQTIVHFNIFLLITVQIIKMFEMWGDVDIMIECFTAAGVQMGACIKSINCIINRHKIKSFLDHIQRDWSFPTNEREIKIREKFAEDGRFLTLLYAVALFGSMCVYLIIPMIPQMLDIILPLNESRQRRFLYNTEYYIDAENNFYLIALHTYTGSVMAIWTVVAIDSMFVSYIQHVCSLLAIVGDRLEKTSENIDLVKCDPDIAIEEDTHYQELIECIRKHQHATKLAILIESSYSRSFLVQLGLFMILISVSLLQLLSKFGQYEEMYRIMQFTLAQTFHLFFNSWRGQKLIDQSNSLRKSIYFAAWYGFSSRSQNLIKIVMMGTASPLKITANRLYDISIENFGKLLQTSISYFTVLASLR